MLKSLYQWAVPKMDQKSMSPVTAVVLDEDLLEYDSRFPAYARVWGIEEHEKFLKRKRLIDDVYLPVNVLKNLEHRLYGLLRFYISIATRPGISDCGRIYNTFRESAVGFEVAALDGESALTAVQINQVPDIRIGKFKVGMKLIHNALDSLEALALKEDPHDFPDSQSQASFLNLVECVASAVIKMVHLTDGYETKKECFKRQERHEPEPFTVPIHYDIAESLQIVGETIELPKLMTADMVPAFSVRGWPRVAEEWITRARRWPTNELVQDVVHIGCQIVAKRPLYPELNGDRKNEDHSSEADEYDDCFRLSFSQCELALAKQFSEIQLLCWRTLKAYQKSFLRNEPPVLTSYHWKTVLFWIREETDDEFWSERNFLNCVSKALDFMITCLLDRFLPGYFVRKENLISGCREDLVVKTLNMVIEIRKAPYAYLLNFVEDPPTPDVYPVSKDKIRDFVRAENQQTLVENITGNVIQTVVVCGYE
ncbi:uncharacterized protein LOC127863711 isoform X2 [Dreissena polymorpha]|uniref:uncharacterized protein LOC127863711 isoform X2 n=1 Tax=Dreissena polymorpha TaxID=45954 RepID=UPI002265554B|nr:uncharacterized protein LOC127863711 isoform X2 [Dreissena polymorpha]